MGADNIIICGGTPTPDDLAKIQEFAAILHIKDDRERRLATLEMMGVDTSPWRTATTSA